MLSLVWPAILECSEINFFQIEMLTPCNLFIFSPLPLSFHILSAPGNIILNISFYDSPCKWARLCYTSLSYALLVYSLCHPLWIVLQNIQDTWTKTLGNIKSKMKQNKMLSYPSMICFLLIFFFSFPPSNQGKFFLKPPAYRYLAVQLINYQAELQHIQSYCCGSLGSEGQKMFQELQLWAVSGACAGPRHLRCSCPAWTLLPRRSTYSESLLNPSGRRTGLFNYSFCFLTFLN